MKALFESIVIPSDPTPVERSAASELQDALRRVTGVELPIVSETETVKGRAFFIGDTEAARSAASVLPGSVGFQPAAARTKPGPPPGDAGFQPATNGWRDDEILIHETDGGLVLTGDPQRGPIYAVCTYLEDYVGVRWWTSSASYYPSRRLADLPGANLRFAPRLKYREAYYLDGFDPLLKVRSKINYSSAARYEPATPVHPFIPAELGGNYRLYFFEGRRSAYHSFFEVLPPSQHFDAHPEWYSLVDGKRVAHQLCLSNDEMAEAYIAETLRRLREMPEANFIQVSQNDWQGACECDACRAIEAEDGGAHSGIYLRFANRVAEAIEKEFPHVMVDTFAYQFTRAAPSRTRPRHNVVVRLCDIECAFNRPLTDFDQNRAFLKDLADWSRIAPGQIFIWDYLADFQSYMMPHPNLFSIAPNIRTFADAGAVGIFEQGDACCAAGEFAPLRFWLVSHLLWNPDADEKTLMADFVRGYYGPLATPHILAYLELVNGAGAASDKPMRCYHERVTDWLSEEVRAEAVREMDAALAAAETDGADYAHRVRREQLSTDHMRLLDWRPEDGDRSAFAKRWIADCRGFGVCAARETTDPGQFEAYAREITDNG